MVKKFLLNLKSRIEWKLLFEVILTAVFLFLAISPIRFIRLIGFICLIVFLLRVYFSHLPQIKNFWFSFWLLPVLILLAAPSISPISPISLIGPISLITLFGFVVLYSILFFILLGVANFLFKPDVYDFFHTLILVFIFLFYFSKPINSISFISSLGFILAVIFLFKEFFSYTLNSVGLISSKRLWVISLAMALGAWELSLVVSFLPLGFINSAVLVTLFLILVRDIFKVHFRGYLNLRFVFQELTILVVFLIIIFVTSFSSNRYI